MNAALEKGAARPAEGGNKTAKSGNSSGKIAGNSVPKPPKDASKADLARWWFEQHPEDREKSGRDLEESAKPGGETISYKYWNKIKKERGA